MKRVRRSSKNVRRTSVTPPLAEHKSMNLAYTDRQKAFRAEIRSWLRQHVPAKPLQSFDTAEGFAEHRAWERTLHSGRWSMVTWPEALGGRGCDLIEWLIFEEEYWRSGAP